MIRKLAFALSLLGASYSGSGLALGLGEATVKSNLNQPLQAEIELVSASEYDVEEILPGLATREEFLKANVDRVYFLSDIRFKVEKNNSGDLVVVLTTNKPVREPFINFLVEVIWPSGRLLREYALLIDPPVFTEEPVAKVKPAQLNQNKVQGDVLAVEPKRSVAQSVGSVVQSTYGASYGPTQSHDTLWDIALKARPDRSVSPQQVMLAIQDLNPGAFLKGNINKLKAGQVLRLPSIDQIRNRSKHQAIEEVIAQNEQLKGKRTKSIATAKPRASEKQAGTVLSMPKDELKLVVASNQEASTNSANSGESETGGASTETKNQELALTLEKLDKAEIEKNELSGRVTDLEEQLQTLQRLLTLKNDQLANIQAQMRANELAKARVIEEKNDAALVVEGGSSDSVAGQANISQVNETALSASKAEDVEVKEQSETVNEKIAKKVESELSSENESIAPVSVKENQDVAKTEKPSENIVETILNNPLYLAIAGVSIIGIVILLWFVSRNNAKREEEYQASLPDDEFESNSNLLEEDEVDVVDSNFEEASENETDYHEELSSDDDAADSDLGEGEEESGEDVLAEADVYIAYGRLDQAATVLENAVSKDPVNTQLRLKLLSVYRDSNDIDAFDRQFSELEAIQDSAALDAANLIRSEMLERDLVSLEDKEHSLELDREISQENNARQTQEREIEAEAEALENEGQTFDFDSVELEEDSNLDLTEQDLDIDDVELGVNDELVDIDLDETHEVQQDELLAESLESEISEEFSAELDDIANELSEELSEDLSAELEDDFDDSILDVDLEDIDMSEELDQETEIELPENITEGSIAESIDATSIADQSSGLDSAGSQEGLDDSLAEEEDFDFLEGTDEASTKLDLARAYIDMGDIEGAKDILEEVASEGNESQKTEANELLNSLS